MSGGQGPKGDGASVGKSADPISLFKTCDALRKMAPAFRAVLHEGPALHLSTGPKHNRLTTAGVIVIRFTCI
jgi:hypothetical protein